jgi:histidyl-tRNA synthetase
VLEPRRLDVAIAVTPRDLGRPVVDGPRAEGPQPVVTPTLVRGLDYYTRTAFEFVSEVLSQAQATLFGGGRYDGLAEALGGPRVPGAGFGMGPERVLLALADEGVGPPREAGPTVFVAGIGSGREAARDLLRTLRDAGVPADALLGERALKAQLKAADRADVAFAAIVGDRDAVAGTATIRRLSDGVQEEVALGDVVNWLARTDGAGQR